MDYVRLKSDDFSVGKALTSAVYDKQGKLLLCKGYIIKSDAQLGSLLERGMYRASSDVPAKEQESLEPIKESPFSSLKEIAYHLPIIFKALIDARSDAPAKLTELVSTLQVLCESDSDAMLAAIHLCHDCEYTIYHPLHQAILCEVIAVGMDIPVAERGSILSAALTANISIIELQETLYSQDSPLTKTQEKLIQGHPLQSLSILKKAGVKDEIWLEAVLQHHETCHGDGYPQKLAADKISRAAAFLAVTDRYTAMVSSRTYRKPLTAKQALQEFFMQRNGGFHEELAVRCIKEMGIYPPGSFVRLESGETAVVTRRNRDEGVWPIVSSFVSPRGGLYVNPFKRDCATNEATIKESCMYEEYNKLNLNIFWEYC